eukprot:417095-Amphidinium_carterae.1
MVLHSESAAQPDPQQQMCPTFEWLNKYLHHEACPTCPHGRATQTSKVSKYTVSADRQGLGPSGRQR